MNSKRTRIRIACGEWTAEVLPGYSMNLISLKNRGEEIIRTPDGDEAFLRNPIVYGNTFLMPPDRTVGGRFVYGGKEYRLPINDPRGNNNLHGLMTDADFEITEKTECAVSGRYENRGERYPFAFACEISLLLTECGLQESYTFTNLEEYPIPLLFGLHSNFVCRRFLMVPGSGEYLFDRKSFTPGDHVVPLTELGTRLREGFDPTGTAVSNFLLSGGKTAVIDDFEYTVSDNFTHWVAWNGSGRDGFASVEPENGPANGLNIKNGAVILEAGASVRYQTMIRRRDLAAAEYKI